ncbi:hypothetical protein ROZALSC1DRAFT_28118, partial [Rozella allomycis CSF55]
MTNHFVAPKTPALVVAKSNILCIYLVKKDTLKLLYQRELFGFICGIQKAALDREKNKEYILLAFSEAKVAWMAFDNEKLELETMSIHFFERDEFKNEFTKKFIRPKLLVDPSNRCAALRVYDEYLAVIPFANSDTTEYESKTLYQPSFMIRFKDLNKAMTFVTDIVFLHGYYEPTLAILYQSAPTFSGQLNFRKDTKMIEIFSLDIKQKMYTSIHKSANLPHDLNSLTALPKPTGGVLGISPCAIFYVGQTSPMYSVPLNPLAKEGSNFPFSDYSQEGQKTLANSSTFVYLENDYGLLILRSGDLYLTQFVRDGRSVSRIQLEKTGASITASCGCLIDNSRFFLGSNLCDSLVIKFSKSSIFKKNEVREEDDLFIHDTEVGVSTFSFSVENTLMNLATIRDMAIGISSNKVGSKEKVEKELVVCSGYGRNSSLGIVHTNLRYNVAMSTELNITNCSNIWSLKFSFQEYDQFIIISTTNSTLVLKSNNDEIQQLESCGFYTSGPSIYCGSIESTDYIFQVYQNGINILNVVAELVNEIKFTDDDIVGCSWCFPYLALKLRNGNFKLMKFENNNFEISEIKELEEDQFVCVQVINDKYGHFNKTILNEVDDIQMVPNVDEMAEEDMELDMDIYGETVRKTTNEEPLIEHQEIDKPSAVVEWYLILYRPNGLLQIVRIPTMETIFASKFFNSATDCLVNEVDSYQTQGPLHTIFNEIKFLDNEHTPLLLACNETKDYVVYKLNTYINSIVFVKHKDSFSLISENRSEKSEIDQIIPFENIDNYSGFFIKGNSPAFVLIGKLGYPRIHKSTLDGNIVAFTPFHGTFAQRGFIYINGKGNLNICEFFPFNNLDYDLPIRKIPLKRTPMKIAYHLASNTYTVATCVFEPFSYDRENDVLENAVDKPSEFPPFVSKYQLELISPTTWETIDILELDQNERVMTVKEVKLKSKQHISGFKTFIVVGTAYVRGEDVVVRGRVIMLDVIDVVPDPNNPQRKNKFKVLYSKNGTGPIERGPVNAAVAVNGYLVTGVGNKILVESFESNEDLDGLSFNDYPLFCHDLAGMRNFFVVCDSYKSLWFMAFQEEPAKIAILGKDYRDMQVATAEFMVDESTSYVTTSDVDGNVVFFSYSPNNLNSFAGQRLLRRGEIFIGSSIYKLIRLAKENSPSCDSTKTKPLLNCYGSIDGGIGCFVPIPEQQYRRLLLLGTTMCHQVLHECGLNP